ncbi:MAG: DUF2249 domain-containing protein [Burkholderiales bacterium]|nr:DUF2249 domain-containing protein [Burkholderiales bacterium]
MNARDPWLAKVWSAPDGVHIDVRGLAAPQPLTQILRLVIEVHQGSLASTASTASAIIVHHDRDPVHLYPELLQLGWWAERIDGEPGEVRLRLAPVA